MISKRITMWLWIHLGLKFDESYGHHVCMKCQKILYCEQTGINVDLKHDVCKYSGNTLPNTQDWEHEDWEVDCNCKLSNMKFFQRIKVMINPIKVEPKWH